MRPIQRVSCRQGLAMVFNFELGKWPEFFSGLDGEKWQKLKNDLLSLMMNQKDMLFKKQVDPDGSPWKPLKQSTINRKNKKNAAVMRANERRGSKYKGHSILSDTGTLKNSIIAGGRGAIRSTSNNEVVLGTNIEYAAIHNFGGEIDHPGTDNGFGMGIKIKPHIIVMPARPFMGIGKIDEEEIVDKITAHLDRESGFK